MRNKHFPVESPKSQGLENQEKLTELENFQNEPVGIRGRPPTSIWINDPDIFRASGVREFGAMKTFLSPEHRSARVLLLPPCVLLWIND
jgi:hypothetical protein